MTMWRRSWEWLRRRSRYFVRNTIVVSIVGAAVLFAPVVARAQFFDPCCAIIAAGFKTISGLLKNVVAKPLSAIQQIQQQTATFEQGVVWPQSAISSARGLASQMQGVFGQMQQINKLPTNSATLPLTQKLEQTLLSHDPNQIAAISTNYAAVYGAVMSAKDAPQPVRDEVDMTDAEAQAALKKAVELDALADVELAAASKINQQIQTAAPGSAPLLEAQAAAWLVRANAYTQSGMAELMRVRSLDLANSGAQLKFNAAHTTTLRDAADQMLGHGAH